MENVLIDIFSNLQFFCPIYYVSIIYAKQGNVLFVILSTSVMFDFSVGNAFHNAKGVSCAVMLLCYSFLSTSLIS